MTETNNLPEGGGASGEQNSSEMVLVGEVTAPFGVRGQVKMRSLMESPQTLSRLPSVLLRFPSGREERRKVLGVRRHKNSELLTVENCENIDDADTLRGVLVFISPSELPALPEDSFYASQLEGLTVITESGRDLGKIEKVHFYPANDVYETPLALVPAVGDIVVSVDVKAGSVLVRDIAGLRKDE